MSKKSDWMNENGKGEWEKSGSFHLWRQTSRREWMSLETIRQYRNLIILSAFWKGARSFKLQYFYGPPSLCILHIVFNVQLLLNLTNSWLNSSSFRSSYHASYELCIILSNHVCFKLLHNYVIVAIIGMSAFYLCQSLKSLVHLQSKQLLLSKIITGNQSLCLK